MLSIEISSKELAFLLALLEADRQTALQLLAAEHIYKPSLLPRLQQLQRQAKQNKEEQA